jgi:phosphatidylethanolamine/phosphatidyl-N-methylethanolamine N-methyltransferase
MTDIGNVDEYYKSFYSKMIGRNSSGLLKYLAKYPHKLMEKPFKNQHFDNILELGAGSGEHLSVTSPKCNKYFATDIDLVRLQNITSDGDFNLVIMYQNAKELSFTDGEFSRLIATCLLAHLENLDSVLSEWRRVVSGGGVLSIYLPCEPGLALRLFRHLVSGRKARSLGYKGFSLYIARDHKNSAHNMLKIINHVFRDDKVQMQYRPFWIRSWYLNLFVMVHITKA